MTFLPRGRRGGRRMDMGEMRTAASTGQVWTGIGVVFKPEDEPSHFEVSDDIGVLVHVELAPFGQQLQARLGGVGSGGTTGIWRIPPVGTEVAIIIPGGEFDSEALIVAVLSSGGTPGELDADTVVVKGAATVLIIGSSVEIRAEGGTANPLVTKAEFDAHFHPTGVGPSGIANNAPVIGTTILKAQ